MFKMGNQINKGRIPWNKGKTKEDNSQLSNSGVKKNNIPWNKGIKIDREEYPNMGHFQKHCKDTIEKISNTKKENPIRYWLGKKRIDMVGNKYRVGKTTSEKQKEIARRNFTGKNNPAWKGGTSKEYKTGYYSKEYKQWRRDVFIRDEFTCQKCGRKHIYLTAHHIKSFAYYSELRFNLNNGQTLCEECHKQTDNYMGRNKKKRGVPSQV